MTAFPAHPAAPEIRAEGLVLCALEARDAQAMLENDRDPETAARFGWDPGDAALWRCERHVQRAAELWQSGAQLVFAVRECGPGRRCRPPADAALPRGPSGR